MGSFLELDELARGVQRDLLFTVPKRRLNRTPSRPSRLVWLAEIRSVGEVLLGTDHRRLLLDLLDAADRQLERRPDSTALRYVPPADDAEHLADVLDFIRNRR